ncbi:MAG TPA: DegT/DnrJ/EryC1/StrS family aminotransferase [Candidatus Competibacteraceae bacterium]|nr:DegT/DnrJ/EryC1/StrS family aminotransferase [Candidatus Competibacteraceae bacterium]
MKTVSALACSSFPLPRGPVLGWASFTGSHSAGLPSVEDLPHVVLTSSGRAAIFQALRQLNLPAGSKVLVPTYHCPTMVAPVILAGLQPIFYAVRADGLPDVASLSRPETENARAVLTAHYFGLTRSLREVRAWCDERGVALIEDCAHAFFGMAGERPVGTWGEFAIASATKFFPVPEGGLLASVLRPINNLALDWQGVKAALKGWVDTVETGVAHHRFQGLNRGLQTLFLLKNGGRTVFQAPLVVDSSNECAAMMMETCDMGRISQAPLSVARGLLRILPRGRVVARRQENYHCYAAHFPNSSGVRPLFPDLPLQTAPYVFPVWFDAADAVYAGLRAEGLPVFRWDRVWPGTPHLAGDHGLTWSHHVLQFLCHQDLSTADIHSVVKRAGALAGVQWKNSVSL